MKVSFTTALRPVALAAAIGVCALFQMMSSQAAVLDFDFASAALGPNPIGTSVTVAGVTARAYVYHGGTSFTGNKKLWQRNDPDDHGLGICSEGKNKCKSGGGNVNEISNQKKLEVLRLKLPTGKTWESLWVSSLDDGGSGGHEVGTLYWSNSKRPNLSALTGFSFQSGVFGSQAEGDLLSLLPAGFDNTAQYLFFRAGPNPNGKDNDYLVWGGNLSAIPEPSSVALLVAGLGVMGGMAARRRAAL